MFFKIIDICVDIESRLIDEAWLKYKIESNEEGLNQIHIEELTYNTCMFRLEEYKLSNSKVACYRRHGDVMFVNSEWDKLKILKLREIRSLSVFALQAFYAHAVQHNMIQIHSSMIDYQGKGLLFLGPSGIGKTTMAELWSKYRDALIINGDMNFVQETDECFLGWGTPWHGSSPYCENTNVPVHALIVLKQASENSIRELKNFEKVQSVSNNIIYPIWLENGMELCLETLDHLLTALPVYELSCRPDEDAVRLTEEKIFGNL